MKRKNINLEQETFKNLSRFFVHQKDNNHKCIDIEDLKKAIIEYIDDSSLLAYNHLGTQIANGSLFFPSVFSGYGIIGAILLFSFFTFSIYSIYKKKEKGQQVFIFYILALVSLIISGIKSDFVGIYFIWFVLSFPFCEFNIKQQQNNLIKNENYYLISI